MYGTALDLLYADMVAGTDEPRVYLLGKKNEPVPEREPYEIFGLVIEQQRISEAVQRAESIGHWEGKVPRVIMKRWWK